MVGRTEMKCVCELVVENSPRMARYRLKEINAGQLRTESGKMRCELVGGDGSPVGLAVELS